MEQHWGGQAMSGRWYEQAIVYSLDVETFQDGDGDGVGDFAGLTGRLDYLAGLGVTCLWLLPFYPSPNRDNGYDVTDYYGVDPRLGTLGDFVVFMQEARERGIRVLVDLVVNHTSDQHPWFQAARRDRHSRYRDYYVWTDEPPQDTRAKLVFPTVEDSLWEYDDAAGAYYLHRFYTHQPDLNIANPAVREEIRRIVGFWLELGVSGFRVDAAPYLIEQLGITDAPIDDPHRVLRELRAFLAAQRGDAILLAESDVPPDELRSFFGDGDEMHLLFNFIVNAHLFLAFARERAAPIAASLRALPAIPPGGQWANFVRNHDELDLERLGDAEREEVFRAFAPDKDMRIFGRGIRRRLPPMVGGDPRRVALAYSLLFTLPGTPVLRYGEEIGMGDDLSLDGRTSVRTPMQWSGEAGGGFSTAPPDRFVRPVIAGGEYGYERVNVARQRRAPDSLLNRIERLIRARKECPEFGRGAWRVLETGEPAVFAQESRWKGGRALALHNLAGDECTVSLDRQDLGEGPLVELLGDRDYEAAPDDAGGIRLGAYGYRWFRVGAMRH